MPGLIGCVHRGAPLVFLLAVLAGLGFLPGSGCKPPDLDTYANTAAAPASQSSESIETAEIPLAEVDGRIIELADFTVVLNGFSEPGYFLFFTQQARGRLLDGMVLTDLLADQARNAGYLGDPEVTQSRLDAVAEAVFQRLVPRTDVSVHPSEVRSEYDRRRAEFVHPAYRRFSVVVTADVDRANRLRTDLEAADFPSLTARLTRWHELAETASVWGTQRDTGFLSQTELAALTTEAVAADAFMVDGQALTGAHSVGTGFALLLVLGSRVERNDAFDDVEDLLHEALIDERWDQQRIAFYADLRDRAEIQIDETLLQQLQAALVPIPAYPLELPGGVDPTARWLNERLTPTVDPDTMRDWFAAPENGAGVAPSESNMEPSD